MLRSRKLFGSTLVLNLNITDYPILGTGVGLNIFMGGVAFTIDIA